MEERDLIRIFLVDDHPIVVSGIKAMVEAHPDLVVVGTAGEAEGVIALIERSRPDLVIVDGSLPGMDGISLVGAIRARWSDMLVLGLTLHEEGSYVRAFLKAGAQGFMLKKSAAEDLLHAIRSIAAGGFYVDPLVASKVLISAASDVHTVEGLSDREESVARLVARGLSNKEISRDLGLSIKTIETYRARAFQKLGVHTRAGLVRHAVSEGWLAS